MSKLRRPNRRLRADLSPDARLFHLGALSEKLPSPVAAMVRPPLESLLCLGGLNAVYDRVRTPGAEAPVPPLEFCEAVLADLDIAVNIATRELERIPKSGAVVVVANHPFGGIEGLILAAALLRVRPDAKVLVNEMLAMIPELRPLWILVDVLSGKGHAAMKNTRGLKESLAHLRKGGVLGVFPAGTVSHLHLSQRRVTDPAWSPHVAALARKTGAAVVPVFFAGSNRAVFQIAGLLNAKLRTALLPREFLAKRHARVRMRIGTPVRAERLATFADDARCIAYLRRRTDALGAAVPEEFRVSSFDFRVPWPRLETRNSKLETVPSASPRTLALVADEIASVPASALLAEAGEFRVYKARARQIPHGLRELGRLREATFRAVGEGSGQAVDFDRSYVHLLLCHVPTRRIAGAYRLGLSDRILPRWGRAGLYTSTLFRLSPHLFGRLGPCVELGRSFVVEEHQRSFAPLMLLWKGIGAFLVRNPRYRYLFGPVSISQRYSPASRALMVDFLSREDQRSAWSPWVTPKTPFAVRKAAPAHVLRLGYELRDADELDAVVSDIEPGGEGMPVLLRHYLRMGARPLAFNVDPAFGNCIDGLCLIDAASTAARSLHKYMGKEGAGEFLGRHRASGDLGRSG